MRVGAAVLLAFTAVGWLFVSAFLSPESAGLGGSAGALEGALFDPRATVPEFALVVFVALLYMDRGKLRAQLGRPARLGAAAALFLSGAFVLFWAQSVAAPDLARVAFIILMLASAFVLGGSGLARVFVFPLFAILLSVPLPSMLAHQLLLPLQLATAELASGMLSLIGVDHVLVSDQIFKRGLIFYVIEGCSGYRAIFSLLLASALYAGLVLDRLGERLALCAIAPVIAFFVNGIRVTTLILREVPSDAPEHAIQGLVMIAIGVFILAALEYSFWSRLFPRESPGDEDGPLSSKQSSDPVPAASKYQGVSRIARWSGVAGVFLLLVLGRIGNPRPFASETFEDRLNIERIGIDVEGMTFEGHRTGAEFLGTTQFRHSLQRIYRAKGSAAPLSSKVPIRLFVGAENRRRRGETGWSPKTRLPGPSWLRRKDLSPVLIGEQVAEREIVSYEDREVLVYHWRSGYRPWWREMLQDFLGLDATAGRSKGASVTVRVEVDLPEGRPLGENLARANQAARVFALQIDQDFRRLNEREIRR